MFSGTGLFTMGKVFHLLQLLEHTAPARMYLTGSRLPLSLADDGTDLSCLKLASAALESPQPVPALATTATSFAFSAESCIRVLMHARLCTIPVIHYHCHRINLPGSGYS